MCVCGGGGGGVRYKIEKFHVFSLLQHFFVLPIYYLNEGLKARLESFWS